VRHARPRATDLESAAIHIHVQRLHLHDQVDGSMVMEAEVFEGGRTQTYLCRVARHVYLDLKYQLECRTEPRPQRWQSPVSRKRPRGQA
jgi:hypothetical protein